MPFAADTLPEAVEKLPKGAQSIWLSVFNSAYRTFAGSAEDKEKASFIAAWGAVRSKFAQDPKGAWQAKAMLSFDDPHGLRGRWTRTVKFTPDLLEAKKRITYGSVYVPWTVDTQGDFADESTIEEAAHKFIKHFGTIGEQHRSIGGKGVPVELFISRQGDRDFPIPGTWVLGTQWSEEMWQKVLNGEVTGYSLGGEWTRIPIVAGAELTKGLAVAVGKDEFGAITELAELDDALFEETRNAGPRVISQIVGLTVDEVSGVSLPANREPFKLFKSAGGSMAHKVVAIGKYTKCMCEEKGDDPKAVGGPFQKLYDQLILQGMSPDNALKFVEEVLGPVPDGFLRKPKGTKDQIVTFTDAVTAAEATAGPGNGVPIASLIQAKYPADGGGILLPDDLSVEGAIAWALDQGTTTGMLSLKSAPAMEQVTLLNQVKNAVKSIASFLGVKEAGVTKGEDAMTPQERTEFDELKSQVGDIKTMLEKAIAPESKEQMPAKDEPKAAADTNGTQKSDVEANGGDGAYQPTVGELELHGRVKELESTIDELRTRPGTSDVATVALAPEVVTSGKSDNGAYRFSSILGTMVPVSAQSAKARADAQRMKNKQARRDSYGANGFRNRSE